MKERNIFIVIIILAIVAIGIFAYRMIAIPFGPNGAALAVPAISSNATSSEEAAAALQMVVHYTDKGFDPQVVTIAHGSTVVFKNEGTTGVWVASAPHPAHTDYPGFDAKRSVGPGDSYSFTFQRIGTWKYHDHLNPSQYGSVIVVE